MDTGYSRPPVRSLENDALRLEYLVEAGPRIVSLRVKGSEENLLAEVPVKFETPYGFASLYGGHRLWHSPEAFPRTYIPDEAPPQIELSDGGVRLIQPTEVSTGIQKIMEIRLPRQESAVLLDHQLVNNSLWPVELAPWAITMLPLGGTAVLPWQSPDERKDGLLPDRQLVFWPYTELQDTRLELQDDLILIRGEPRPIPVKIGYRNRRGWAGYYRAGVFFCKRFDTLLDEAYPDFGCSAECYCKDLFIELETLGPLTRLEPGQSITHAERWEITSGLNYHQSLEGMRELVKDQMLD